MIIFGGRKIFDKKKIEFKDFLKRKLFISEDPENLVPSPPTNWPIYSINNKLVLDHIGQFEDLNNHISIIEKHIGLKLDISNYPWPKKEPTMHQVQKIYMIWSLLKWCVHFIIMN